jgi:hypothetical protein
VANNLNMKQPPTKPAALDKELQQTLRTIYSSERADGASLMTAGFTQIAAVIAYVGVIAVLIGKEPQVDNPHVILCAPIPALVLLLLYVFHSFNQGIRATSGSALETLLLQTALHSKADRESAIGLHATEKYFNASKASSRRHRTLVNLFALTPIAVVLGFLGVIDAYGISQLSETDWEWALWAELAAQAWLLILIAWAIASGIVHRTHAENAAEELCVEVARSGGTSATSEPQLGTENGNQPPPADV